MQISAGKKRRASQRRCYPLSPSTSLRKQHLLSPSKARKWKLALYNSCRCRLPRSQSSSLLLQESKNSQLLWSTGSLLGAVTVWRTLLWRTSVVGAERNDASNGTCKRENSYIFQVT